MPRKPTWPPRVTKHASGQARVRHGGRDYYLGAYDSPEAKAAYARLVARLAAGSPPPAKSATPPLTVGDVVLAWWDAEGARLSPRGRERENYRHALRPLDSLYGPTPAADFDVNALEAVQLAVGTGSWMTEGERANPRMKPCCRNVVNRRVGRIRHVWKWAERKGLVPKGSYGNLRTLPPLMPNDPRVTHTKPRKPATWAELMAVVRECRPAIQTMLLLQWWSGMRTAEVRTMRPCDIDTSAGVWVYRPEHHKNDWRGQERLVPLGPKCQALLLRWLRNCAPGEYLFRPARRRQNGHPLLTGHVYAQAVRRAAAKAGVTGFHAYRCRHSAKQRITRALGLDVARAVLGQKSLDTTNSYAAGIDLETAKKAARRCG